MPYFFLLTFDMIAASSVNFSLQWHFFQHIRTYLLSVIWKFIGEVVLIAVSPAILFNVFVAETEVEVCSTALVIFVYYINFLWTENQSTGCTCICLRLVAHNQRHSVNAALEAASSRSSYTSRRFFHWLVISRNCWLVCCLDCLWYFSFLEIFHSHLRPNETIVTNQWTAMNLDLKTISSKTFCCCFHHQVFVEIYQLGRKTIGQEVTGYGHKDHLKQTNECRGREAARQFFFCFSLLPTITTQQEAESQSGHQLGKQSARGNWSIEPSAAFKFAGGDNHYTCMSERLVLKAEDFLFFLFFGGGRKCLPLKETFNCSRSVKCVLATRLPPPPLLSLCVCSLIHGFPTASRVTLCRSKDFLRQYQRQVRRVAVTQHWVCLLFKPVRAAGPPGGVGEGSWASNFANEEREMSRRQVEKEGEVVASASSCVASCCGAELCLVDWDWLYSCCETSSAPR